MSPQIVNDQQWSSTTAMSKWNLELAPGPYWPSFEQLRVGGAAGLDEIKAGFVGTLQCKAATFRVLRDEDFQRLVGLASDVHRLKHGVTLVLQAARIVCKHPEQETFQLLIDSASLLAESRVLPERAGHDKFEITEEEAAENTEKDPVRASEIPRPAL
jgi:hypothetical protein